MEGWSSKYLRQRKHLAQYQLSEGEVGSDINGSYLWYSPTLLRVWFSWKVIIFLIDVYYINECLLWLGFYSLYQLSSKDFLALNIILMSLLFIHTIFKVMMTTRLPSTMFEYTSPKTKALLYLQHFCRYDYNALHIVVYIIFSVSFFLPYAPASWLHTIYTLRIVQIDSFLSIVYTKIHTSKPGRVIYRITILTLIILYLSHFFAIIFYILDQRLMDNQYFGGPNQNANYYLMYYQFNSASYMPIEMLSEPQRYIMALYFGNGLVSNEAYGDIVGQNWIQTCYVGILMVVSTTVTAFLLQEFLIMMENNRFAVYNIVRDYKHLEQLMVQKNVSSHIRMKIRNYVFYNEYFNKFQNPNTILVKLTNKMKIDLFQKGYGSYFQDIFAPLGFTNIRKVCQFMQEKTYQPEINLLTPEWKSRVHEHNEREGNFQTQVLKPSLMYLVEGKILQFVQWQPDSQQFYLREDKVYLNTFQFFTKRHNRYAIRTKSIVKLVILKQEHFLSILQEQTKFQKELCIINQMVSCNSMSRALLQDDCQICNETDHSALNCPETHYVVDADIVKANKIQFILSDRKIKRRVKERKTLKSLRVHKLLHYTVIFANLTQNVSQEAKKEQKDGFKNGVGVSFLQKTIKNLILKVHLQDHPDHSNRFMISTYDPEAIDSFWKVEHN